VVLYPGQKFGDIWSQLPEGISPLQYALDNGLPASQMGAWQLMSGKHAAKAATPWEAVDRYLNPQKYMSAAELAMQNSMAGFKP
jgi:hypothetical protein